MVGFFEKVKSQIEIWKIEKYTKRRTFLPEYDSRDTEYYKQHYRDGVYYNEQLPPQSPATPRPGAPQYRSSLSKHFPRSTFPVAYTSLPIVTSYPSVHIIM
ncbi:hypothetical protein DM01DRAFT_1411213 [Hesseltinella vesiculosa]|uniref:Uncharacterized protein n=1 Tax=Hesseltinella vesiculosa TaxID=101127 RepID=A0A1X2G4G9_9FUNG|nr:hypothetical protein DM01DRAFT_1411213 [Hesseltinella vesiculosa]